MEEGEMEEASDGNLARTTRKTAEDEGRGGLGQALFSWPFGPSQPRHEGIAIEGSDESERHLSRRRIIESGCCRNEEVAEDVVSCQFSVVCCQPKKGLAGRIFRPLIDLLVPGSPQAFFGPCSEQLRR
jgi:hypothetical protein